MTETLLGLGFVVLVLILMGLIGIIPLGLWELFKEYKQRYDSFLKDRQGPDSKGE